ncbi:DUF3169 family protein [Halalkalibacter okhensis]|uniref:DUF3169 domain-containing protein n=1 Tax=Halalkalibacter okhensis TaxID=333138 RepID=A0A0B0IL76_9BACI|nr:DUF3169 family protein [Halalkalibacter okhensis]KHF41652.1 hypothetical protein LQ50_02835 [Halalkalibacter okhensis]
MKNSKMKMILIMIGSAIVGFFATYFGLVLQDANLVLNREWVMQVILYSSIVLYFVLMVLFVVTRQQLKKEKSILDEDEKEAYIMNKVTNLVGYSSFMQLLSILIFALTLIHVMNSDGLSHLIFLVVAWIFLWVSNLFIRFSFKENNNYLPDMKYFYKKNESITKYVSRLDEAQKLHVYRYCFSIVEKMKILFLAAFGIAVFVTIIFDLTPHLLLGIMLLWLIFQLITILESKKVRV